MRIYLAFLIVTGTILLILISSSCETDYFVPEDIEIPDTVSFKSDVIPIFNASCNTSGCHETGGYSPDLTKENAYIYVTALGLIDSEDPESSILYTRLISRTKPMPPDGNLSPGQIELILKWIEQGALDN